MKLRSLKKNLTEVEIGQVTILFSYKTPVACHIEGQGYFRTEQKWSTTTSRHINEWLREMGSHDCESKPQKFFDTLVPIER